VGFAAAYSRRELKTNERSSDEIDKKNSDDLTDAGNSMTYSDV
jgi:hypothetical protein